MQRDMTQGDPKRAIIAFTLPLLAGNILQQLYNVINAVILGRFVGSNALAAVSASSSLVWTVSSLILGMCMGISVLVSQQYGARDYDALRDTLSTSAIYLVAVTALLTALMHLFLTPLLAFYRMPASAMEDARAYLKITFNCLIFYTCFNAYAFLLRAVGDSRSPLFFLSLSMALNILLDLTLVFALRMGVRGVAISTAISQGISALCILLYGNHKLHFLKGMKLRPRLAPLMPIVRFSAFTGLQQSGMNVGGLFVHRLVNSFGVASMAAFAACGRIDSFVFLPTQDIGSALATYIAQNTGAGKPQRIRDGLRFSMLCTLGFCAIMSIAVVALAPMLLSLMIDPGETEVLAIGTRYLAIVGSSYIGIGVLSLFYGYFRGIGLPHISLILTVVSLGTRVAMAYGLAASVGAVDAVWWAIPTGWMLADIAGSVFYFATKKKWVAA